MKNKVIYNYNGVLINYIQPNSFEACIDFIKVNFILNYITNFKYVNEEGNKVFISSQKELNDAIRMYEDSNLKTLQFLNNDDFKNSRMEEGFIDINQTEESEEVITLKKYVSNISNSTNNTKTQLIQTV